MVRFLPSEGDTTRAADTAASFIGQWGERVWRDGYWPWAVVERSSGRLIGHAGLRFSAGLNAPELVYMFDDSVWGRGYASEAANAACDFGRDSLNLDYVAAVALADNAGSVGRRASPSKARPWRTAIAWCDTAEGLRPPPKGQRP